MERTSEAPSRRDRRGDERREASEESLVASEQAFDREELEQLRAFERRLQSRRRGDAARSTFPPD